MDGKPKQQEACTYIHRREYMYNMFVYTFGGCIYMYIFIQRPSQRFLTCYVVKIREEAVAAMQGLVGSQPPYLLKIKAVKQHSRWRRGFEGLLGGT